MVKKADRLIRYAGEVALKLHKAGLEPVWRLERHIFPDQCGDFYK